MWLKNIARDTFYSEPFSLPLKVMLLGTIGNDDF